MKEQEERKSGEEVKGTCGEKWRKFIKQSIDTRQGNGNRWIIEMSGRDRGEEKGRKGRREGEKEERMEGREHV